ncbi:MAG: hypothetical protein GFH27_549301n331 [Chloroflexi bacterium AL-W]|nr:hypothetical protein [Chloroflexi bacterium AL-N1]NOK68525.1 hypothetical protein [Chloroflexi bacterium AL-N10]NOK74171.1 hypothetical protein [Chloroflexi bacterium AL-N5]NOK83138.1 hypothetical protein [Chloroflexi bacterium AL-W]NOK90661.1 hypothetical protein [Chloroflexi bacterium AL-N15]
MSDFYKPERYLLRTLDPVHVGTGGNRLGRVDLSIVREPGTRLPKIPGTALHGAIRQYAAIRYEKLQCVGSGQSKDPDKEHCKEPQCPICYTFGYLKGQDGGQSGKVSIGDARLLLFPVYSLAGPIWVSCPSVLAEFDIDSTITDNKVKGTIGKEHLNLGWLMLEKEDGTFNLPDHVPPAIKGRAVLVSDKLFSQIVNSNLEVRTSVSIDPETGAAADKALFTYEAIPRAAILWLNVIEDDFSGKFPQEHEMAAKLKHERPLDVVIAGLKLAEMLGVGGMGTRGFGRVRLLNGESQQ